MAPTVSHCRLAMKHGATNVEIATATGDFRDSVATGLQRSRTRSIEIARSSNHLRNFVEKYTHRLVNKLLIQISCKSRLVKMTIVIYEYISVFTYYLSCEFVLGMGSVKKCPMIIYRHRSTMIPVYRRIS